MLALVKNLMDKTKKIIIVLTVFIVVLSFFLQIINKDKPRISKTPQQRGKETIYKTIDKLSKNKTQEGKIALASYRSLTCTVMGEGCSLKPESRENNFNKSLLGSASSLITAPIAHPPASGLAWTGEQLSNAGFLPKTYAAQGIGFAAIQPFQGLWKIFRDIAFMVIVFVMIAIGFMIMFRVKINPQTVISIENALPRIVLAMILITFSYAIAGFLIDIMYVSISLIISLLSNAVVLDHAASTAQKTAELQNKYLGSGFEVIWDSMWPKAEGQSTYWMKEFLNTLFPLGNITSTILGTLVNFFSIGNALYQILPDTIQSFFYFIGVIVALLAEDRLAQIGKDSVSLFDGVGALTIVSGNFIGTVLKFILNLGALLVIVMFIIPFIIGLIIFFTILLVIFRIFFMLLSSYIKILLLIFFAPIILLFEAIPGRGAFAFWFKSILGEILTFPLVVLFFLASNIIVNNIYSSVDTSAWQPPFLYSLNTNAFAFIVGIGLTLMIPDLVKMIKEAMGVKGMPVNFGVGTFFAGAGVALGGGLGIVNQFHSLKTTFLGQKVGEGLIGSEGKTNVPILRSIFGRPEEKKS